jgi:hypothetical protein
MTVGLLLYRGQCDAAGNEGQGHEAMSEEHRALQRSSLIVERSAGPVY